MQDRDKLYIVAAWVPSTGSNSIDVINAATEAVMGRIPEGTPEGVDRAVAAAKPRWPRGATPRPTNGRSTSSGSRRVSPPACRRSPRGPVWS